MTYYWILLAAILLLASSSSGQRRPRKKGTVNFLCTNTDFIPIANFCDGVHHCSDQSDENAPEGSGAKEFDPMAEFQWCDNEKNNHNGSCLVERERICSISVECRGLTPCDLNCDSHYKCQKTNDCHHRRTVCNNDPCDGCEEDHGWRNGVGFKCVRHGQPCILPQQMVHDDIADCDGKADVCFSGGINNTAGSSRTLDTKKCFQCLDDVTIISASSVCDGVINCPDLSDECLCDDRVPDICKRVIAQDKQDIKVNKILASRNVTLQQDPVLITMGFGFTVKSKPNYTKCETGRVMCSDGKCIHRENICDGIKHCENDESYDICRGTVRCTDATRYEEVCRCDPQRTCQHNYGTACDGIVDCPIPAMKGQKILSNNTFPEDECEAICPRNDTQPPFKCWPMMLSAVGPGTSAAACKNDDVNSTLIIIGGHQICDGIENCPQGEDEGDCPDRFRCISNRAGFVSIRNVMTCDGTENCANGTDETVELCGDKRFHCPYLGGVKVSIKKSLVCDLQITCDDETDEMNCTDGRFHCENKDPLFVRKRQTFDGRKDCSDWSDECPMLNQSAAPDAFSSRYELIANPILRVFVWIMGLSAIFGNSVVIYRESKNLRKSVRASALTIANRMLVLNLACSDVIMGIYLISLAGVGLSMQGHYCANDLNWRSSNGCITLGIMTVISSETSVLTMVLLAGCRLYAVVRPFDAGKYPRKHLILLLLALAWAIAFLFALVPLAPGLQDKFVTEAEFRYNPFSRNVKMPLDDAKSLYRRLMTYDIKTGVQAQENMDEFLQSASWTDMEDSAKTYFAHDYFHIVRHFGYYSAHSVCVPKFFASRSDAAWGFSFFINFFNFLAFSFVASAYVAIQLIAKKRASARGKAGKIDKGSKSLQRKILRLIITDFCCWIPICLISFCKLAGAYVGNTAYAVSAIILLPINSALNPLLYSDLPDLLYEKIAGRVKRPKAAPTASTGNATPSKSHATTNTNDASPSALRSAATEKKEVSEERV